MPPSVLRAVGKLNVPLYRLSRGRIGGKLDKAPVLLLETTGRRSGKNRVAPALYLDDAGRYVVIGSNAGNEAAPAWALNLVANPDAAVEIRGQRRPVRARVAEGPEREDLWRKMNAQYAGFDHYRERTDRDIKVFVLEMAAASLASMCRNIRTLYNFEPPATEEEVSSAALQYVRKISGFTKPSQANEGGLQPGGGGGGRRVLPEFLGELVTNAPPKDREVEAEKRRARAAERYAGLAVADRPAPMSFEGPAEGYDSFMGRYSRPSLPCSRSHAGIEPGMRVVDVGCGPGALTETLAGLVGADHVAAAEPSPASRPPARPACPRPTSVRPLPRPSPGNDEHSMRRVAQLVIHFMADPAGRPRQMQRVVKPGSAVAGCTWDTAAG